MMWDLTKGLSRKGIDCDMLCAVLMDNVDRVTAFAPHRKWEEQVIEFNEHGQCICVAAKRKMAATMISPAMVWWLRRHKGEYDIIHIHHPDPMACLALKLSGFKGKVVLHWHSDILKQQGLLKFYEPLQNWLVRRADIIVGTTPVYAKESPYLKAVQDKVTYLPIGIEDNLANPDRKTGGKDVKVAFSLGRLVEYKGYEYLVEAAKYLPDGYEVHIGGSGPLREEIETQIIDAGLEKKVKLLGHIPDDDVAAVYNSCDVFVLSSVMKTEAFGIVQIEAMSCGKPVVATHIPGSGVDWVNADGVSGLNVPARDPKALASAIVSICSDEERYERYCKDSRARYESLFSFDGMIDGALGIYHKLLGDEG